MTEQSAIVSERINFKQNTFLQDLCTTESTTTNVHNNISLSVRTTNDRPMTSTSPIDNPSDSFNDDDSFLCNNEKRKSNLPFVDLITNQKDHDHSRIIFQNVNSLELSSGQNTL